MNTFLILNTGWMDTFPFQFQILKEWKQTEVMKFMGYKDPYI